MLRNQATGGREGVPASPSPTPAELEREINRLQFIMQDARESATRLLRYADRIANGASSNQTPTTALPSHRSQTTQRQSARTRPSNSDDEVWADSPHPLHTQSDPERLAELLRERRIRDIAANVDIAASGVDRIMGFMGREGQAALREARNQRTATEHANRPVPPIPMIPTSEERRQQTRIENMRRAGWNPGSSSTASRITTRVSDSPSLYGSGTRMFYPEDLEEPEDEDSLPTFLGPTERQRPRSPPGPEDFERAQDRARHLRIRSRLTGYLDTNAPAPPQTYAARQHAIRSGRMDTPEDRPFHQTLAAHRRAQRDYMVSYSFLSCLYWTITDLVCINRRATRLGMPRMRVSYA